MTRNVNLPNFTTTEDPGYVYRSGRVKDSLFFIRRTEAFLEYLPGASRGMIASIIIFNGNPPEIPVLDFPISLGWEYYDTRQFVGDTHHTTRYRFLLEDDDSERLRDVAFYFDTLYG